MHHFTIFFELGVYLVESGNFPHIEQFTWVCVCVRESTFFQNGCHQYTITTVAWRTYSVTLSLSSILSHSLSPLLSLSLIILSLYCLLSSPLACAHTHTLSRALSRSVVLLLASLIAYMLLLLCCCCNLIAYHHSPLPAGLHKSIQHFAFVSNGDNPKKNPFFKMMNNH